MSDFPTLFRQLKVELQKAIVGYDGLLGDVLTAIFSGGHVLLEGVPGLGKTYLVRTLSQVIGLEPGRVQCTPDLMPADILGTHIVGEDERGHRTLRYEKGPVFRNLLLVDEINRATPKTQAALLEVMQERCVTTGGERHLLPEPFFVLATQNPMEMEGTYPLPEAQLDRFLFKIEVPFPKPEELHEIVARTTSGPMAQIEPVLSGPEILEIHDFAMGCPIARHVVDYAVQLVHGSHGSLPGVQKWLRAGASPRALQALVMGAKLRALMHGRPAASIDDIKALAKPALRHRLLLSFDAEADRVRPDQVVEQLISELDRRVKG
jgi:MoxR-like ATPase